MAHKILITGALGYLGGRIAQDLSVHADSELLYSSRVLPDRTPEWLSRGRCIEMKLEDDASCEQACRGVDVVIHLASLNEIECLADPVAAAQINGVGTLRLVRAAQNQGVRRFIYFSTAHVYGSPLVGEISEAVVPRPAHPYASSHLFGEMAVLEAHDKSRLIGLVMRLSNGVGVPATMNINRWTLVANDLCRTAAESGRLELRSSGLAERDFVPISDVCAAVRHGLSLSREKCGDGVFNFGAGTSMTVWELAQLIARRCECVLGFTPEVARVPPGPRDQSHHLCFRVDKFLATGFRPRGGLESEIDSTLRLCHDAAMKARGH